MKRMFEKEKEIVLLHHEDTNFKQIKLLQILGYDVNYNYKTGIIRAMRVI